MGNKLASSRSLRPKLGIENIVEEVRELSLEERREKYACGANFKTIEDIPTWSSVEGSTEKAIEKISLVLDQDKKKRIKEKKKKKEKKESSFESIVDPGENNYECNEKINAKISLIKEDITSLEIDAVVNAANKRLLGGGGIDGAIHRAAGPNLVKECATLEGAETGETKITKGYNLPAKHVLHTVGPIGENEEKLKSCYSSCLERCVENGIKTVAFCGVSTGIYGYPLYAASHIALRIVREWLAVEENFEKIDLIIFCTFLPKELDCYQILMPLYFPSNERKNTKEIFEVYKKEIEIKLKKQEEEGSPPNSESEEEPTKEEDSTEKKEEVQEDSTEKKEDLPKEDDSTEKKEEVQEDSAEKKEDSPKEDESTENEKHDSIQDQEST